MDRSLPVGATDVDARFVDGNPTAGIRGSIPKAEIFNNVQDELIYLLKQAGLVPNMESTTQVYEAIQALISAAVTGDPQNPGAWALALRQIIAGKGLSGGGDLSANRTLTLAINTLDALAGGLGEGDSFAVFDTSAGKCAQISWADLKAAIASAITVAAATAPALNGIGSFRMFGIDTSIANGTTIAAISAPGTVVSGSVLLTGLGGSWRIHGSSPGRQDNDGHTWTSVLACRIA